MYICVDFSIPVFKAFASLEYIKPADIYTAVVFCLKKRLKMKEVVLVVTVVFATLALVIFATSLRSPVGAAVEEDDSSRQMGVLGNIVKDFMGVKGFTFKVESDCAKMMKQLIDDRFAMNLNNIEYFKTEGPVRLFSSGFQHQRDNLGTVNILVNRSEALFQMDMWKNAIGNKGQIAKVYIDISTKGELGENYEVINGTFRSRLFNCTII